MQLGWLWQQGTFRLLAPLAQAVSLVERKHPEQPLERITVGQSNGHGIWEIAQPEPWRYYRFRVQQAGQTFDVSDPWSTAAARQFVIGHPTWSVAQQSEFAWQEDARPAISLGDAVIVELHIRDFTAHPSAGVANPGTYLGLAQDRDVQGHPAAGGLAALRDLGVNAVELLPVTAFPWLEQMAGEKHPTGQNHWGYMPSLLLCPSERYALAAQGAEPGAWIGVAQDGTFADPGDELREMIRRLHSNGIAVLLDVVFNHVSLHDDNPLLRLDPGTWFLRNPDATLRSHSGCGNDLNTAHPAMRALVLASVHHWVESYHVDGFRLDLADILDDGTLAAIEQTAKAVYSKAIVVSEPWSMAGYRPVQIAELGHGVWNDRFRNGIKGSHPNHGPGVALGTLPGGRGEWRILMGGSARRIGGWLPDAELSVNYLESHDDHTSGDFVRLALHRPLPDTREALAQLLQSERIVLQFAASCLLLSRGAVMIAQGQSWGRAKVIAGPAGSGAKGWLDGNSWCRDDETNHLDWRQAAAEPALHGHYRRLIALRKQWLVPAFAEGTPQRWLAGSTDTSLGYLLATQRADLAVLFHAAQHGVAWFDLHSGPWHWLLTVPGADLVPTQTGVAVAVPACSAVILWRQPLGAEPRRPEVRP